uniref:PVII n=1 Tax=short-tailed pygmy chameleon adenovirus 1 TaxID=1631551 RepID=A0A0H3VC22_9ADEN|nr:pVII [short-tailed pygmy chameleon adenovirus 1]
MSILISPSDNTGWGVGNARIRGTGLHWSDIQPVRVQKYYRGQWGQANGRTSKRKLRKNLVKYTRRYGNRQRRNTSSSTVLLRSTPDTVLIETARKIKRRAIRRKVRYAVVRRGPRLRYTRRI